MFAAPGTPTPTTTRKTQKNKIFYQICFSCNNSVNTQGYLVTKDGDYVLNANDARNGNVNGRIQVDPTRKITVDELGNIYQNDQQVGTIGIVDFADYDYLAKYGENMYDLVNGGTVPAAVTRLLLRSLSCASLCWRA